MIFEIQQGVSMHKRQRDRTSPTDSSPEHEDGKLAYINYGYIYEAMFSDGSEAADAAEDHIYRHMGD